MELQEKEWELEELEDPNRGSNVLRDPAQEKADSEETAGQFQ